MADLVAIAERIANAARADEQIEAYVAWHRETEIRVYEQEIESLSSAESSGIGIRVIAGHRQGFAYVGDLDEDLAKEALNEARDNASFASEDPYVGLAIPDGVRPFELDLYRESLAQCPTEQKIALAVDLDNRVRNGDPRVRKVVSTDYGDAMSEVAIASSLGVSATSRKTTCFLASDVVAGAGDDTQTGDGYTVGRSPEDLDLAKAASDAITRATRLLGAKKPKSQRVAVVLDPRITATFLSVLASTLSGEEVAKGRSLFARRMGEQVGSASMTLVEDPTDARAYGAARVDAEGLACRRNVLIDAGRLEAFLYDTYSARMSGTRSTASAVRAGFKSGPGVGARALVLVPGDLGQDEILAKMGSGLLVQGISGVHSGVNRISGDFSVGAEGLLFKDGALAGPVREVTIASSIQRMLKDVQFVGNDLEWLPSVASGVSLGIAEMAMSGA